MVTKAKLFLYCLGIFCLMCSCSGKEEEKLMKYSDLEPDNASAQKENKNEPNSDSLVSLTNQEALNLPFNKIQVLDAIDFTDRFGHVDVDKYLLETKRDSIHFKSWKYSDSIATMNAFYNLLDCFDADCKTIDLFSEEYTSERFNLLFVSNEFIHWIQSGSNSSIHVWDRYLRVAYPTEKYQYILEQKRNKNLKWMIKDLQTGKFYGHNLNT